MVFFWPDDTQVLMDNECRIVIFANGRVQNPDRIRSLLLPGDRVVCADGGTRLALTLGLTPELVIGDLDSLTAADRARLEAAGVALRPFPRDKDETDLELAMQYALDEKPASLLVIGALGGRLDQTLGNISLLGDPRLSDIDCRLDDGTEEVIPCRQRTEVHGKAADLVSLVPWGNAVSGVRTEGLGWPLRGEILYADKTRGLSNEMLGDIATVQVESGLLLIIHTRRS